MLARHFIGVSGTVVKARPVVFRSFATRSWREWLSGKKPEEKSAATETTTTQSQTPAQPATPTPSRPPAPYTPYNIGNPLYPFLQEVEKYPGVNPTPVRNSKLEFPVIDFFTKQQTSSIEISRENFNAPLRTDILHRVVVFQLDGKRQGTASTKTRAEVRGGGKKPWAQKGTGRARIGSIRAPHWRGGGVTFGPKPRDHSTDLPLKIRAMGLRVALSTRLAQGKLVVVDNLHLDVHKTKDLVAHLPTEWGKILIVEGEVNENLKRASGSITSKRVRVTSKERWTPKLVKIYPVI